ncbi:putative phage tail protein [Bosea sp. BK604]|uniref:YmfQ family protein n=1 Tax=Bosea sp. BK604 TaxID=2512180 RepID=UPI0010496A68|nr:putative phage tail protein [Bosea sp. BK604]TCR60930.1 uncharacterized protein YmfQ (DUF2313 family) [Bosea sp. BK604]
MPDQHVQRSGADYAEALAALLPPGPAWPRETGTALMGLVAGLAEIWGDRVDARAADLLERESDPRATIELLEDWERMAGLPDACLAEPLTIGDRQRALVARLTMLGGQSRAFFIGLAASLGYEITITEHSPFMAGISHVGDTRYDDAPDFRWEIGPAEVRYYWNIHMAAARLTWFRANAGQAGVDPHLRIGLATDLECLIRRFKPAHTEVFFDYTGIDPLGPMTGTP